MESIARLKASAGAPPSGAGDPKQGTRVDAPASPDTPLSSDHVRRPPANFPLSRCGWVATDLQELYQSAGVKMNPQVFDTVCSAFPTAPLVRHSKPVPSRSLLHFGARSTRGFLSLSSSVSKPVKPLGSNAGVPAGPERRVPHHDRPHAQAHQVSALHRPHHLHRRRHRRLSSLYARLLLYYITVYSRLLGNRDSESSGESPVIH